MKNLVPLLLIGTFILASSYFSLACKRSSNNCTATRVSLSGLGFSHNNAQQCQNCHIYNGIGSGCFSVAGSVYQANGYDAYAEGEIRLYTHANGQGKKVATLQIDAKGNFYTTNEVDFSPGLYPAFVDGNGKIQYMAAASSNGNCNTCHSEFAERIIVK